MADRIAAVCMMALGIFVWYVAWDYPPQSKLLPIAITGFIMILSLAVLLRPQPPEKIGRPFRTITFCAITLLSIVIMEKIGFFVDIVFFVCAGLLVQGVTNIRTIFLNTVFWIAIVYLVFIKFLAVPLPTVFK